MYKLNLHLVTCILKYELSPCSDIQFKPLAVPIQLQNFIKHELSSYIANHSSKHELSSCSTHNTKEKLDMNMNSVHIPKLKDQ